MPLTNYPDGVDVGSLSIDGDEVTATPEQLNKSGNVSGQILGTVAGGRKLASGKHSTTGAETIATGLTTVTFVVVSLETPEVGVGKGALVGAKPSAEPGKIDIAVSQIGGTASTIAQNVHWVAYGT